MDDLSLKEIGENLGISRSAVFDAVKKSSNILMGYEEKLGLLKKEEEKRKILSRVEELTKEELVKAIEDL